METETEAALATSEGGGFHCDHFGRDGLTIDYFFHNTSCSHYKKDIKYDFSGSRKPYPRRKHKCLSNNDEGSDELPNIALIGVTVHEITDGKDSNYALKGASVMKEDARITPQSRDNRVVFDEHEKDPSGYFEVVHKKSERVCFKGFENIEWLYEAIFTLDAKQRALAPVTEGNQTLWHERLGHASHYVIGKPAWTFKSMSCMEKQSKPQSNCEDCVLSKSCRKVRPSATIESADPTKPLDLVHTDIIGPMKYSSFGGKRYIIPLYDDCSAVSLVRFLKTKDETGAAIKEIITELETMRQGQVKKVNIIVYEHETVNRLRSDNAK